MPDPESAQADLKENSRNCLGHAATCLVLGSGASTFRSGLQYHALTELLEGLAGRERGLA